MELDIFLPFHYLWVGVTDTARTTNVEEYEDWNAAGLDEAGIDGGGLFREFLSQLLKAAFDPNRGFFTLTRDQMLYPRYQIAQFAR